MRSKEKQNRFEKITFVREIDRARGYRRSVKPEPKFPVTKMLARFGVRTWLGLFVICAMIAGLSYVLLFPNFLWVSKIDILISNQVLGQDIKNYTDQMLAGKKLKLFARRNLLFIKNEEIKKGIEDRFPEVKTVSKVRRVFPSSLQITVEARSLAYVLFSPEKRVTLFSDGVVIGEYDLDPRSDSSLPFLFYVFKKRNLALGDKAVSDNELMALEHVRKEFSANLNLFVTAAAFGPGPALLTVASPQDISAPSSSLETAATTTMLSEARVLPSKSAFVNLGPQDMVLLVDRGSEEKNFFVYLPLHKDIDTQLERLFLLYNQMEPSRKDALSYIDVRYSERAFLCIKKTPCEVIWEYGF